MTVLLDTSILIDALRGQPAAIDLLDYLPTVPACSEVTRAELLRGMRSAERGATARLIHNVDWIPVDEAVSRRAGEFGRRYRRSHGLLGLADLFIAATADLEGIPLLTLNLRHFPMFPELKRPYEP